LAPDVLEGASGIDNVIDPILIEAGGEMSMSDEILVHCCAEHPKLCKVDMGDTRAVERPISCVERAVWTISTIRRAIWAATISAKADNDPRRAFNRHG
jgi:hypothetical protein